jgi:lipoprotein signal peptidase
VRFENKNIFFVVVNLEDVGLAPGTDVMILKIFSPKNFAKKMAFFTQNNAKF